MGDDLDAKMAALADLITQQQTVIQQQQTQMQQ